MSKYTADTSKVGSQISGVTARRISRKQRRVPKFDVPNLEVSKVYPRVGAIVFNSKNEILLGKRLVLTVN